MRKEDTTHKHIHITPNHTNTAEVEDTETECMLELASKHSSKKKKKGGGEKWIGWVIGWDGQGLVLIQ